MNRTATAFLLIAILTGLLAALSIAVEIKGYAFGALGVTRLDGLASAGSFIPLAAIYAFAATLIMILPLRPASFVMTNAAMPAFSASLVLLATITGVQAARFAFGNHNALFVFIDWQFIFAAAIIAVHLAMNELRRNALLRTIFFIALIAATLACLYWTFQL